MEKILLQDIFPWDTLIFKRETEGETCFRFLYFNTNFLHQNTQRDRMEELIFQNEFYTNALCATSFSRKRREKKTKREL